MTSRPSLSLPASALIEVRRALGRETDDASAARALHDAGYASGERIFDEFEETVDSPLGELDVARFWSAFDTYLSSKGWGRISHERIHPALGVLRATDWSESDADAGEERPACWFTGGMIERLLSGVAPGPILAHEASCRSRGDPECSFLIGSQAAIERLRQLLLAHESLDDALAHL